MPATPARWPTWSSRSPGTSWCPAIELAVSRFAEKRALEDEVASLNERFETRKVVDRAKGLLMTHQKMSEPEAFRWIQRTAMDRRTTMKAVADAVIDGLAPAKA